MIDNFSKLFEDSVNKTNINQLNQGELDKILAILDQSYEENEKFTTLHKKVSCEKAIKDLKHNPRVNLADGLRKTVEWMKEIYLNKNNKGKVIEYL